MLGTIFKGGNLELPEVELTQGYATYPKSPILHGGAPT
jgi:hypothetical protein